jgi:tryptophanyl-tRNA synthetase
VGGLWNDLDVSKLYSATHIPIGEDNFQHIQLAQHTAQRFNRIYGETFVVPKAIMEGKLKKNL